MLSEGACTCGWNTPTLERVEGRRDDIVTLPDGRRIGRLDHILKNLAGIREAQLVQYTRSEFVLYVVPESRLDEGVIDSIRREARMRLGPGIDFKVEPVAELQRTATHKLRSVISLVDTDGSGG